MNTKGLQFLHGLISLLNYLRMCSIYFSRVLMFTNLLEDYIRRYNSFDFFFFSFVALEAKLSLFGKCRDVKDLFVFQQKVENMKSEILPQNVEGQVAAVTSLCGLVQMGAQHRLLCSFFCVFFISVN